MAPIPRPLASTVRAIFAAYEDANTKGDNATVSISTLAEECDRKMFYDFRWCSSEKLDGRKLRIFETGNVEEERMIENLRMIGCEVVDVDPATGKQITVYAGNGHIKGKLDSEILGLPEAPQTIHVGEIKSHNAKSFSALLKDGVKGAKPMHFAQLQTYMYLRGRDRGIYLAVCKDTDELYAERVELDAPYVIRLLARAERIIGLSEPPAKLHEDPTAKMAFACGWCKHKPICHETAWPRNNCRTCLYSTPEAGGTWSCARFNKPLTYDEQQAGCPAHLWLPAIVPGTQTDVDEEAGTVTYELKSGRVFVDGGAATPESFEHQNVGWHA